MRLTDWLDRLKTGRAVSILLGLNLVLMCAGFRPNVARIHPPEGPNILELELCFTPQALRATLLTWAEYGAEIGTNTLARHWWVTLVLDSIFPVLYAAFLFGLYAWIARLVDKPSYRALEWAPWIAGGLDVVIENVCILLLTSFSLDVPASELVESVTQHAFPGPLVLLMASAAALKILLLVVSLFVSGLLLVRSEFGRIVATCRYSFLSILLGSLPLIALDQGQDILRGLVDLDASVRGFTHETAVAVLNRFCAVLALVAWAACVWYWARVLLSLQWDDPVPAAREGVNGEGERERAFRIWLPRVLGTLTLFLAGVAFFTAIPTAQDWRGLAAFGVVCWVSAGLFCWSVATRRRWQWLKRRVRDIKELPPAAAPLPKAVPAPDNRKLLAPLEVPLRSLAATWRALPAGTRRAATLSFVTTGVFFVLFTFYPVWWAQTVGTLTVLLLAAANAVFLGSATVFVGRVWKLPLVTLALVAAAVFSLGNDNHAVRLLAGSLPADADRPELRPAFDTWFEPLRSPGPASGPVPVFLVATEGGGIRAAYWTAAVLARLQDRQQRFARHLFAISGVSGGSVGAAVFAGLVAEADAGRPASCALAPDQDLGRFETCTREILRKNFLAPVLAKLVAPDFAQWVLPFPVPYFDRARALEASWSDAYRGATGSERLAQAFQGLRRGVTAATPALFLNSAHVETGRRLLHSHLRWSSTELPDAYDFVAMHRADVSVVGAAHDSARFAYVSPAALLRAADGGLHGHAVDGGYFENSGAATVKDLLVALTRDRTSDWRRSVRVVVLYLCNEPARCYGAERANPARPPRAKGASNLAELFSPVRALLGARQARGSLALEELRHELAPEDQFVELGICPELAREKKLPLPLGWQLSAGVRKTLDEQVDATCTAAPVAKRDTIQCLAQLLSGEERDCRTPF